MFRGLLSGYILNWASLLTLKVKGFSSGFVRLQITEAFFLIIEVWVFSFCSHLSNKLQYVSRTEPEAMFICLKSLKFFLQVRNLLRAKFIFIFLHIFFTV